MSEQHILNFDTTAQIGGARRVCYYTNWSQYRQRPAKFFPGDIEPGLCTHLVFAFAKLENDQLAPFEWNDLTQSWDRTPGL